MRLIQNKKYGGGISDLGNDNKLPIELQYLFQNKYLDCIKILIVLNEFPKRKKGLPLAEVVYYFTMTEMVKVNQENYEIDKTYLQENMFLNEKRINKYIVMLTNQKLINVYVEIKDKKSIIFVKRCDEGNDLILGLQNEYFAKEIIICKHVIEKFKYSVTAQRKVLSKYEE